MKQNAKNRGAEKAQASKSKSKEKPGQVNENPDLDEESMAEQIAGRTRDDAEFERYETD